MEWKMSLGIRFGSAALLASVLSVCGSVPSWSQQAPPAPPAPDRSQYNLFNPTPDDALRDFSTDRPTKATGPFTVDGGRYQLETDLTLYTYDYANDANTTTRTWTVLDPTLRIGLTSNIELDIISSGFYNNVKTTDRSEGTSQTNQGFGDITLRSKFNLIGNDGGDVAFAIIPQIKFPTNTGNVGNNAYEGGVLLPVALAAPLGFTLTVMPQFDALKNSSDNGHHAAFTQIINLSRPIVEGLTGYVEFFSQESAESGSKNIYTFDTALAYVIAPNLQFDIGTNIGLNKAAPDIQAYVGVSKRF
ncbi:MAG: transporter [Alphaproteobacteria bacterium]|nr:transporter [Alphaproteobacteria bacterium]